MTDSARHCVAEISSRRVYTAFDQALRVLFPAGTPRQQITDFFDNRVPYETIKNWRRGLAGPPAWATERMREKADTLANAIAQIKIGPGQKAGTENLRKWHARKKD